MLRRSLPVRPTGVEISTAPGKSAPTNWLAAGAAADSVEAYLREEKRDCDDAAIARVPPILVDFKGE